MKKYVFIIMCVLCVCTTSIAWAEETWNIEIGESFSYKIKWMGVSVGRFEARVAGETVYNDRPVYIMEMIGGTNRWTSMIYRIRDRFVSYVDKEKLVPLKLEVSRREGFYKKDAVTIFDHEKGIASFHNTLDNSRKDFAIPDNVVDLMSVFYQLRHRSISLKELQQFDVIFAETIFTVYGQAEEEAEYKLPNGKHIAAYYSEPWALVDEKVVRDGKVNAYFSNDPFHIPLRITLKAPLFTKITATLEAGDPHYS